MRPITVSSNCDSRHQSAVLATSRIRVMTTPTVLSVLDVSRVASFPSS
jgi:hypothetical protein